MKQQLATTRVRYCEPVLDTVPGVQHQVDPGELRNVLIGGEARIVVVLSFSRWGCLSGH